MIDNAAKEKHRQERGMILTLMAEARTPRVAFRTLLAAMDRRGITVSPDTLTYHLERYLEMQGYVALTRSCDMRDVDWPASTAADAIQFIRLTPSGLHIANDGGDPEVKV